MFLLRARALKAGTAPLLTLSQIQWLFEARAWVRRVLGESEMNDIKYEQMQSSVEGFVMRA